MTDPAYPPASGRRALHPGGGVRLRQAYTRLLIVSSVAVIVVVPLSLVAALLAAGDPDAPTLLTGAAVTAVSSALLLAALIRGRAAVEGDQVAVRPAATSAGLSRLGSAIGWLGALAVLAVGVAQHFADVDDALLEGIVLAGACLIVAVCNDATARMAKRLIT